MTKHIIFILFFPVLFSSNVFGQSYSSEEFKKEARKIRRISADTALLLYKSGKVVLADSMSAKTFSKYHIFGAISLPGDGGADLDRITKAKLPIPRHKLILVYCD